MKKTFIQKLLIVVMAFSMVLALLSCSSQIENIENSSDGLESSSEETTVDFESLPEEVKESIEYSPSKDFKKVGTREKKDEFCFVGDIILHTRPRAAYDKDGIDGIVDNGIRILFNNSDFNIANLECAITDEEITPDDKEFTFALPSKYVQVVKDLKINMLTLANNHILDFGEKGLLNTIKVLDDNGIIHIGAGKNIREADKVYIREIEGKRYAFLSASAVIPKESWKANASRAGVCNGYDTLALCTKVNRLKLYVDKVIVYMHWGGELEVVARELQKLIGRRLVDAGADLVVGTHAHVVQEIEYYNNVPIVYSLGNFIYGGTMRDMILLKATFDYSKNEKGEMSIRVYPGVANYTKVSRYYKPEVLSEKIATINHKSRNCIIDGAGNVLIKEKVDESKIKHKILPGIFETTAAKTSTMSEIAPVSTILPIIPFPSIDVVPSEMQAIPEIAPPVSTFPTAPIIAPPINQDILEVEQPTLAISTMERSDLDRFWGSPFDSAVASEAFETFDILQTQIIEPAS